MTKPKYTVAMKSIIGTRDEQQDCAFHSSSSQEVFAIVCDGMGGMESGKLASAATIECLKSLYDKKGPNEICPDFFLKAVDILDELVFNLKNEDGQRMGAGTTIVAAIVENNNLFWLSIGDSRLYILRGNEFVQVTRDHNYFLQLDTMVQENEISESQYHIEAARGEALISFIGMGGIKHMDINNIPFVLQPKDIVLLSTDGLYKTMSSDEIKQYLQIENLDKALNTLIEKASEKAKSQQHQDNTTCVLIKYDVEDNHETH